jgi:hypothetical protein
LTRTFCTLFDKNYLYQGVALHRSLQRHGGDFKLYALCMDSIAHALLTKMNCPTLVPVAVDELLTPAISAVRARTTHGQFCWVCQPLICEFLLDRLQPDMVTYLEADSLFFSSPEPLFAEMAGRSASLVPHNYSREFDNSAVAGLYCVQFNAFANDSAAREVLAYWREWCFKYDKSAPTVYPGQTSLDDWPGRFPAVAVIRNPGAGVAPWNIRGYELTLKDSVPYVNGLPAVFFHYHQYGRFKNGSHDLGNYPLSQQVIDYFYRPYIRAIEEAAREVRAIDPSFAYRREYADTGTVADLLRSFSASGVIAYLRALKRKVRGRYNVFPDAYFSSR